MTRLLQLALITMDAEGFKLRSTPQAAGIAIWEGRSSRSAAMQAAKCFTCNRVIAWSVETAGKHNRLTWIAEKHQVTPGAA